MGERVTPAGDLFRWRPAGVGRRAVPCARCGAHTPVWLLENLLEALCAGCGRNLALERARVVERAEGALGLARRLVAAGALDPATLEACAGEAALDAAAGRAWLDRLIERGDLRRDLRLTLELDHEGGAFAYGAAPLAALALPAEVEAALEARRQQGGALPALLAERVLDRQAATIRSVGAELGLEALRAGDAPDPSVSRALPPRALALYRAVPVRRDGDALVVALWNPLDAELVADLEALVEGPVHAVLAEPDALDACLAGLGAAAPGEPAGAAPPLEAEAALALELVGDPLDDLLLEALEEGAREVWLEPRPRSAASRLRVGGEWRKERQLPREAAALVAERLEALAGGAREGRVRCEVSGLPVGLDFRLLDTPLGPSVGLELEAEDAEGPAALGELGLGLEALARLEALLLEGPGLVVVAAPRRGGKTRAYLALLERAVRLGGAVLSLERAPDGRLEGATQVELAAALARGGDALLRPAPDWLGVDGPLDARAVGLVADACLAGATVVCTVTAPDAGLALARLELAGLPRDVLAGRLRAVLARRVVPRTCPRCRVPRPRSPAPLRRLGWDPRLLEELAPSLGLGCPACADTGAAGVLRLAELALPGPQGLRPFAGGPTLAERARALVAAGDVPLEAVADLL